MKHVFIVNPVSGQGKQDDLINQINELIAENEKGKGKGDENTRDIKLYYTRGEKDATVLADMIAKEAGDEMVCVYACGGDGTINEVVNGLVGHENAAFGVVPVGSGNDFVRAAGGGVKSASKFLNLRKQINGELIKSDVIKMTYMQDGEMKTSYAINGINIGFDGNTAILAHNLKELPLVAGSFSYILAVASNLIAKKGQSLRITADGEEFHFGPLLLATTANGGFCGGGVESCPYADLSDGYAELLAIKNMPRWRFVSLFPKYQKGKIFEIKDVDQIAKYRRAKEITIEPLLAPTMKFVADGEIYETGTLKIEMLEKALWLMIPEA